MNPIERDRELLASDAAARKLATSSFDFPLLLEAGAGTGKTTTLIARLVVWTLGPGWERASADLESDAAEGVARRVLEGVVAITFTEAAAADMEEKLAAAYGELARGKPPLGVEEGDLPELWARERRARALARALDRPVVHTIHAFCRGLLADHPFEAGLAPSFDVDADQSQLDRIAREVVENELAERLAGAPDDSIARLVSRDIGAERMREALVVLAARGVRPSDLEFDPYTPDRSRSIVERLARAIDAFLAGPGACLRTVNGRATGTLQPLAELEAVRAALPRARTVALDELDALADRVRELWSKASRDRLKDWTNGTFNVTETKCLADERGRAPALAGDLASALHVFRRMRPCMHDSARKTLARLLERVRRELTSRGIATYTDLLHGARDLVRDHPHVVLELRSKVRQLVVDEFQDTDPVQCEIIRRIALDGTPAGEKPALFVVGDPKQSIYGWRSADLAAYESFAAALEREHGGRRARLSLNHRSTRRILADVERTIAPIMHAVDGMQPSFQPLVASRHATGAPVARVVPWRLDREVEASFGNTSKSDARAIEAAWIANDLTRTHEQGAPWRRMAILLRATGDLETYLSALRDHGVPYEVAGDKSFYRRREIIEASVLVRAVVDPRDHVALVALLRSSLVGVPDAALVPLWRERFHEHVTEIASPGDRSVESALRAVDAALPEVPRDVPGIERVDGFGACLLAAVHAIARLRQCLASEPSDVFVEELRTLFLVEAKAAPLYLGPYRVSNLDRFFQRLAEELDEAGDGTQACLRALRDAVRQRREAEEARPKDSALDAVQVLTIHKAKGLDFDHVYVADMDRGEPASAPPICEVVQVGERTSYAFFGSATPGYEEVEARRGRVGAAERVRTLYVAMTRAKERLVLCTALPAEIGSTPLNECGTHLDLVLQSTASDAPAALLAAHEAGEHVRSIEDVEWILPTPRDAARSRPARVDSQPGETEIPEAMLELPRARATALARMQRRWATSATSLAESASNVVPRTRAASAIGRSEATAIGRAFHRMLEGGPRAQRFDTLRRALERELDSAPSAAVIAHAKALYERFAGSELHRRWIELDPHVLARELPVLLPPEGDDAATGFISGAIDLVYLDPSNGEIVIADYKTDATLSEESVARHAAQGRAYQRAIRGALDLEREPRFELWLLAHDRIQVVA